MKPECATPDVTSTLIKISAMKSAVSFLTDLTLAGHYVSKTQASEMTFWRLEFVCKIPPVGVLTEFSIIVGHRPRHMQCCLKIICF